MDKAAAVFVNSCTFSVSDNTPVLRKQRRSIIQK